MVLESDDDGARDPSDDDAWVDEPEEDDSAIPSSLHPADLRNFLKLCAALRIFLSEKISEAQLIEGDRLIREYCQELLVVCLWLSVIVSCCLRRILQIYGTDVVRPNHHYATHTAEFIRDYGPMREFWTFVFERLNKILKAYKTSNHDGGEVECTFFREFQRMVQLQRIVSCVLVSGISMTNDSVGWFTSARARCQLP